MESGLEAAGSVVSTGKPDVTSQTVEVVCTNIGKITVHIKVRRADNITDYYSL